MRTFYRLQESTGEGWYNTWFSTQAQAVAAAKESELESRVDLVQIGNGKDELVELLNQSGLNHVAFDLGQAKVWPKPKG